MADSQFILIDEVTISDGLPATMVNQMCDGTYLYPQKGGLAKQVPAIILICGNKDPQELYPNAW